MKKITGLILLCIFFNSSTFSQKVKESTLNLDSVFIDASYKTDTEYYNQLVNSIASEELFTKTLVVYKKKRVGYPENKDFLKSLINKNMEFKIYTDKKKISKYTRNDNIKVLFRFKKK